MTKYFLYLLLIGLCVPSFAQTPLPTDESALLAIDSSSASTGKTTPSPKSQIIYGTIYKNIPNLTPEIRKHYEPEKDLLQHQTQILHMPTPYPNAQFYGTLPEVYEAVSNVKGILSLDDGTVIAEFTSNEEGHFLLYNIPNGSYHVDAEDPATGRTGEGVVLVSYKDHRAYLLVYLNPLQKPNQPVNQSVDPPAYPNSFGISGTGGLPLGFLGLLGLIGADQPDPVSPSRP